MSLSSQAVVLAAREQIACDLAGETVILNPTSGIYYGLDHVGARIWGLIQQPTSVARIRDAIVAEYEVAPDRCEQDLLALLQKLGGEGLVEVRDDGGA